MTRSLLVSCLMVLTLNTAAQTNRIDQIRPDAPDLAPFGDYDIGVRTLQFTNPDQPDIVNTVSGEDSPRYDRTLTVELWYPADLAAGQAPGGEYQAPTRNTEITATLYGSAVRDAAPLSDAQPFPLVIISHGYPGNRFLLSHLGESLASRGYVVASIDHLESTYGDQQAFTSTLYFRTLDQRFILDQIADLAQSPVSFLHGLLNAERTAVVGYSMGGYGLINNLGAGYNPELVNTPIAPPNQMLGEHTESNPSFRDSLDPRIVAGVAIAPWGMNNNLWRVEDLQNISVPALYVAGTADTVSGYENGTRTIFEQATGSDRYLLTFENAGHSAGAPIPVPLEILESESGVGASHYTDPVWDTVRMNNVMDHFVVAFLDYHLKGMEERLRYLDLTVTPDDEWHGFSSGPAVGLRLEHRETGD